MLFAGPIEIEPNVQNDAHDGGDRRGQANLGQAGVGLDAHKIRQGQAHQKGLDEALHHDPQGLIVAVEVAHHTEQDGGHDGLRREALQVLKALLHDLCVGREDTGQQIALEQDEHEHNAPEGQADANPRQHGLFGPRLLARAHVLGDEGGHGLHQGAGDEHGKIDNFAGDAVTGGSF